MSLVDSHERPIRTSKLLDLSSAIELNHEMLLENFGKELSFPISRVVDRHGKYYPSTGMGRTVRFRRYKPVAIDHPKAA